MPRKSKNTVPESFVDTWPEVLKDVEVNVVPTEYLQNIRVYFVDGKIWDIDIAKTKKNLDNDNLTDALESLFEEYEDVIQNIDFRLNTAKIKEDIQKRTRIFMKKRK